MKQLNETITGEVIRIDKVKDSGIFYTVFENTYFRDKNEFGVAKRVDTYDLSYIASCLQSIQESINDAVFAKILETEIHFVLSDDLKNWCIPLGSTGNETTIRVIIPDPLYNSALKNRDNSSSEYYPLWQIINIITQNLPSQTGLVPLHCSVQYLEELLPEHKAILETEQYVLEGLVIEEKID